MAKRVQKRQHYNDPIGTRCVPSFEVLTAVLLKIQVWDVTLCCRTSNYWCFKNTKCIKNSKTTCPTICHIPEDFNLQYTSSWTIRCVKIKLFSNISEFVWLHLQWLMWWVMWRPFIFVQVMPDVLVQGTSGFKSNTHSIFTFTRLIPEKT
jgi:hypothetical protein